MLTTILATTAALSTVAYGWNMQAVVSGPATIDAAVIANDGVTSTIAVSTLSEPKTTVLAAAAVPDRQGAMIKDDEDDETPRLTTTKSSESEMDIIERDDSNSGVATRKYETVLDYTSLTAAQVPMGFPHVQAVQTRESLWKPSDSQATATLRFSESETGKNKLMAKRDGLVTSVPQMQSTMAPVEAEQTYRSYTAARSSASRMSKWATQKGSAAATRSAAAAELSQTLKHNHDEIDKNLQKSCNGDKECETRYKDNMNKHNDKAKGKGKHHKNAGAHLQLRVTSLMAALGGLALAASLI